MLTIRHKKRPKASGGITYSISDKTDDYQILNTDLGSGATFTMFNAGTKTFTLPTAANMLAHLGFPITFVKKGAGKLIIIGASGQYIADGSSGGSIYCDIAGETYASITLMAITTTQFVIIGMDGTWSIT